MLRHRCCEFTAGMARAEKSGCTAGFCGEGIDRKSVKAKTAGVGNVPSATTNGARIPEIHHIKHQRRMDANRGMQTVRRLPGTVAHAGDKFTRSARRMQRHLTAV